MLHHSIARSNDIPAFSVCEVTPGILISSNRSLFTENFTVSVSGHLNPAAFRIHL